MHTSRMSYSLEYSTRVVVQQAQARSQGQGPDVSPPRTAAGLRHTQQNSKTFLPLAFIYHPRIHDICAHAVLILIHHPSPDSRCTLLATVLEQYAYIMIVLSILDRSLFVCLFVNRPPGSHVRSMTTLASMHTKMHTQPPYSQSMSTRSLHTTWWVLYE